MTCLDDEQLVRLSRGVLAEDELALADEHLDACETCRRVLCAVLNEGAPADSRLIGDRYELDALIGAGAYGLVWRARDVKLERRVAVKLMRRKATTPLSEARLMARVSHPSVVQVFDVGEDFVAMEYVAGPTLRTWLAGAPSFDERQRVMREAGEALAAVHRAGLVHRDFKPDNVLIDASGRARVTDFGVARAENDGSIAGTPAYMAPEQLAGGAGDHRSDQFAYCVTFSETLTGKRTGAVGLPSAIERGLERDPARRFESMEALLAALSARRTRAWWPAVAIIASAIAVVVLLFLATPAAAPPVVAPTKPVASPPPKPPPPSPAPELERDFIEEEPLVEPLPPASEAIVLAPGGLRTFRYPRLAKVYIEDPEVLDAAGNADELQLEARNPGRTRLTLEAEGRKRTWWAMVREPVEVPSTRVQLKVEERWSFDARGPLRRLSIGDSTIVDVTERHGGTVGFQALKPGRTNCLFWTQDARRLEVIFDVRGDAPEEVLSLEVGVQRVLQVKPFVGAVVKPPSRASLEIVGATEVLLVPREVGDGQLEFTGEDGKVSEVRRFRVH